MAEWLRAKTSFAGAAVVDGKSIDVDIAAGKTYRSDHPAVAGRENMFEPLDEETAAPTRRRGPVSTS